MDDSSERGKGGGEEGGGGGRCFKDEVLCCNGCLKGGEGELKADIAGCIPIDTMSPGRSSSLDMRYYSRAKKHRFSV